MIVLWSQLSQFFCWSSPTGWGGRGRRFDGPRPIPFWSDTSFCHSMKGQYQLFHLDGMNIGAIEFSMSIGSDAEGLMWPA